MTDKQQNKVVHQLQVHKKYLCVQKDKSKQPTSAHSIQLTHLVVQSV